MDITTLYHDIQFRHGLKMRMRLEEIQLDYLPETERQPSGPDTHREPEPSTKRVIRDNRATIPSPVAPTVRSPR